LELKKEKLLEMYRKMLLIRNFDHQARIMFTRNMIRGTTHTYLGEEAIAVGTCAALRNGDVITSTHRGHGHCLAKGGDPKRMMAELLGRTTGYCKGKGGSMHIADFNLGILGANGIVGGGIGIATGAAFTLKYLKQDTVAICFFGDGAINQGIFYEVANMAAMWELPVIYICEDNQYAEFSPAERTRVLNDLTLRGIPFGIPSQAVDGNDVLAVYALVREQVQNARKGNGPSLIIAQTYRLEGHHVGDAASYRNKAEVEQQWKKDPIARFKKYLLSKEYVNQEEVEKLEKEAQDEILIAVDFALQSPVPVFEDLLTDVYVE